MKKELNEILTTMLQLTFQGVNGVKGSVFFIGIGGIGMSALARYFNAKGINVSGYDKTETLLTKQLQAEGIGVHYEDNIDLADKNASFIVYTPADKSVKVPFGE